jgi:hypothetical protein
LKFLANDMKEDLIHTAHEAKVHGNEWKFLVDDTNEILGNTTHEAKVHGNVLKLLVITVVYETRAFGEIGQT